MSSNSEILVVEDSPLQAQILRRLLEGSGYHVALAANGKEALSRLRSSTPRLIISDILMPEMDGYELCAAVKKDDSLSRIPILLLTTLTDPEDVIRGLEARADGYLTKPFDPDYLLSKVRSALAAPGNGRNREVPLEFTVAVGGKSRAVSAAPRNFFDLILSAYENTVHTNQSLLKVRMELEELNRQLEEKVKERTDHLVAEIADRQRAEEDLQDSYERFRSVVETAHDPVIGADSFGNIVMWNSAATQTFGYSTEEAMGQPVTIIMPERFRQMHERAVDRARETGSLYFAKHVREVAGRRKDGAEFPVEVSISAWKGREGVFFTGIVRDITERKRAEEAQREAQQRLELVMQGADLGPWDWDLPTGQLVVPRTAQLLGYSPEESEKTARFLEDLIHPDDRPSLQRTLSAHLEGETDLFEHEHRLRAKSGEWRWFLMRGKVLVRSDDGKPLRMAGTCLDITPRKKAEESLRTMSESLLERNEQLTALTAELRQKSEEMQQMTQQLWQTVKLATIGELAASIAHELNNPLATVSLRTEGLLAKIPSDDPSHRSLEVLAQETERMANLVANLLQFSRRYRQQVSTVNVNEEIGKTLELIHGHLRNHRIAVEHELAPGLPMIHVDRQQLRQVFLNLFTNASDAMPNGGTLTIRTDLIETQPGFVRIEVSDTGVGIDDETLGKVMEPFFTTKPEGKGTGLGLPICRRIVQEHGGTLDIASEVAKGTTVAIVLPTAGALSGNFIVDTGGDLT